MNISCFQGIISRKGRTYFDLRTFTIVGFTLRNLLRLLLFYVILKKTSSGAGYSICFHGNDYETSKIGVFVFFMSKFVCTNKHYREIFVKIRRFLILFSHWRQCL